MLKPAQHGMLHGRVGAGRGAPVGAPSSMVFLLVTQDGMFGWLLGGNEGHRRATRIDGDLEIAYSRPLSPGGCTPLLTSSSYRDAVRRACDAWDFARALMGSSHSLITGYSLINAVILPLLSASMIKPMDFMSYLCIRPIVHSVTTVASSQLKYGTMCPYVLWYSR